MNFAMITEGVSEHRIVKHIIAKYFKEYEPKIRQIQPKIVNDRQEATGGWNEVLKYCGRDELKDIFVENDYLVIQIDTDQSQTAPFSVNHSNNGRIKPTEELYDNIREKLESLIKPEIKQKYSGKIIFAVCIHTIECWLLPVYYNNRHRSDIHNCLFRLNTILARRNIRGISAEGKNTPQSIRTYEVILRNWRKRKDIIDAARYNAGFQRFIDSLGTVNP